MFNSYIFVIVNFCTSHFSTSTGKKHVLKISKILILLIFASFAKIIAGNDCMTFYFQEYFQKCPILKIRKVDYITYQNDRKNTYSLFRYYQILNKF